MRLPKIKPCPKCGNADLNIYTYDNGWRHVECDECFYLGPGEGNKVQAVKSHNEQFEATKSIYAAHAEVKP
ncbi:Zn ribbon nucleic-acid-binding protein [Ochrobactrum sp. RH1CCR137]|nr:MULTISPECIES: hypothetical protein [unclassified Ochrobactrum]MBA8846215.1 Zn ribbon nucleic-acid-binding protein [Ochrobactrum sp. RH1CCR137]MBA8858034.1 Zn ribbon nucleic-acid-binding protein [Ochrobactrum sp. RH1CCR134]